MATRTIGGGTGPQIFVGVESGLTVVAPGTPLTRLNYYDGKFLRADDLDVEQGYFRHLTWLSNVAGGSGVVYGFDVGDAAGDAISLSPGLAIDQSGHVLLLPQAVTLDIQTLIDDTERLRTLILARRGVGKGEFSDCIAESVSTAPPVTTVAETPGFYLITIAPAEALCGEDYAYGTLCEEACATSVQRPRRLDGIAVRAWPFTPRSALPTSGAVTMAPIHLRSRLASARFADETTDFASLIAGADLHSTVWCHGACAPGPNDVALAVLARSGSTTLFVDEWTARRELIETPPRRYWAGRMGMRPLAVFLAQVLHFQCQLRDILPAAAPLARLILNEAIISRILSATDEVTLKAAVTDVPIRPIALRPAPSRVLINGGIVELSPAGYLPVGLDTTVNAQVRNLLGEGLDLTFCVVRADYVPHALEEAQHMERISLLAGLDDPAAKPDVEILVPDGEIVRSAPKVAGTGWDGHVQLTPTLAPTPAATGAAAYLAPAAAGFAIHGAGRSEILPSGGGRFHFAGTTEAQHFVKLNDLARGLTSLATPKASDFHLLGEVAQAHANEPPPSPPSETLVTRLAGVAREAVDYVSNLRTQEVTEGPKLAHFQPQLAPAERVVGLWTTMGCDRDPFSLRLGEITAVQVTVEIAMPAAKPTMLTNQLRGDFRVDRILPMVGAGRRIAGTLSGIGVSTVQIAGQHASHAGAFARQVTLVLADPPNAPPSLDVAIEPVGGTGIGYDIHVSWEGTPLTAKVGVALTHLKNSYVVPLGTFTANPDVLVTGNQANTLARSGLSIIAAALADPAFAETAEALLFPPPVEPASELTVKPHRNWVLFRRRRIKDCAPELVVVPPPAKHYDLFELAVGNEQQVTMIRDALWKNQPAVFAKLPPRYVDRVEFGGGSATLNTAATTVRADWQAAHPAKIVQYAAIADIGPGEGDLLARSRLASLEQTLAPVAAFDPNALAEAVPDVPAPLVRPGADGAILIVTRPQPVQTTCMLVLRINASAAANIKPTLQNDDVVVRLIQEALAPPTTVDFVPPVHVVGKANFDVGSPQIASDSATALLQAWTQLGGQKPDPGSVFVFSQQNDASAEPSLLEPRVTQVVEAMGGPQPKPIIRAVVPALPGGCPSVAFVFAQG